MFFIISIQIVPIYIVSLIFVHIICNCFFFFPFIISFSSRYHCHHFFFFLVSSFSLKILSHFHNEHLIHMISFVAFRFLVIFFDNGSITHSIVILVTMLVIICCSFMLQSKNQDTKDHSIYLNNQDTKDNEMKWKRIKVEEMKENIKEYSWYIFEKGSYGNEAVGKHIWWVKNEWLQNSRVR